MKRILIPTNFSPQASWAIEVAAYLARRSNAELVLLHVVEYPTMESFDTDEAREVTREYRKLRHDPRALVRWLNEGKRTARTSPQTADEGEDSDA